MAHIYQRLLLFIICIAMPAGLRAQKSNLQAAETCNELYIWIFSPNSRIDNEPIYQPDLVITAYTDQNCRAFWYNSVQQLSLADTLLAQLYQAQQPEHTHATYLEQLRNEIEAFYLPLGLFDYNELYTFDVLLTDAALHYALRIVSDRYGDEAVPGGIGVWVLNRLEAAIKTRQIGGFFEQLRQAELPDAAAGGQDRQKLEDALERAAKANPTDTLPQTPLIVKDQALYDAMMAAQNTTEVARFGGERVFSPVACNAFYRQRQFVPAWLPHTTDNALINSLLEQISNASTEGLKSMEYHTVVLQNALKNPQQWLPAQLDLLLTDAAMTYAQHLAMGKLNPRKLGFSWDIYQNKFDWATELQAAIDANNLKTLYDKMKPKQAQYGYLKQALATYQQAAAQQGGTWQTLNLATTKPELGARDPQFAALRQRLLLEYPQATATVPDSASAAVFDTALLAMVKNFQRRHNLGEDGKPGAKTYQILNISAQQRVQELQIALEMWRWLPNDLGKRYIMVNVPAYMLYLYENGQAKPTQVKRVVVGEVKHKTPIFSDQMQYIELNPYWTVPPSIAKKEILPALKRQGSAYLTRNKMELFSGGNKISPAGIRWSKYSANNFPFVVRQKPNGKNALGEVKFLFPNAYNVYLHDTPSRHLFAQTPRAFSHGCIRLHEPLDFAAYLLKDLGYTRAKIDQLVAGNNNQSITLPTPIPIYITYFTTWADEGGAYFYDDVYSRDATVAKALGF